MPKPITIVLLVCFFLSLIIGPNVLDAQTAPSPTAPTTAPRPAPSSSDTDRDRDRRQTIPENVAALSNGRVEYVVSGPIATSDAAIAALQNSGARLVSFRDLPSLGRRIMIFDLGLGLNVDSARNVLAQTAPSHRADFNHLYSFAQGSQRLYAANLIGQNSAGDCRFGQTQRIGMIDGPVDQNHPALQTARIFTGSTLAGNQRSTTTRHGTAVATLLVGNDPDNVLTGFASGATLYAVSAFAREHSGAAADVDRIAASVEWLLSNGVRMINMSFVGPENVVFADILAQAERSGAVMLAAAGNSSRNGEALPASSPSVIAVTAVDAAKRRYRSANRGGHIEFAAPGVDIYVAKGQGGGYASGTSYAAPIVTALASRLGPVSLSEVRRQLQRRAEDLGSPGRDQDYGWGLVRAAGC